MWESVVGIIDHVFLYWQAYTALALVLLILGFVSPLKKALAGFGESIKEIFTWSGFLIFAFLVILLWVFGVSIGFW